MIFQQRKIRFRIKIDTTLQDEDVNTGSNLTDLWHLHTLIVDASDGNNVH